MQIAFPQLVATVLPATLVALACSSTPDPSDKKMGAGGTASAGTSSSGGSAGTTGGSTNAGGTTAGGTSGGTDTAGGSAGTTATGGGGTDSAGGTSGGTGGEGNDLASELDGFRLEVPCNASSGDKTCSVLPENDVQSFDKTFGGDPGTTYDVTVHIRGLVEPMTYTGGTATDRFYVGGTKNDAEWNVYSLVVTAPAQSYFFNYSDNFVGDARYTVAAIDYEFTVPMQGGTAFTIAVNGQNGNTIKNFESIVVPPDTDPYDGQFLEFDVVSVVAQ